MSWAHLPIKITHIRTSVPSVQVAPSNSAFVTEMQIALQAELYQACGHVRDIPVVLVGLRHLQRDVALESAIIVSFACRLRDDVFLFSFLFFYTNNDRSPASHLV